MEINESYRIGYIFGREMTKAAFRHLCVDKDICEYYKEHGNCGDCEMHQLAKPIQYP